MQLRVKISDTIISEGLSFNLYQKTRLKKVLELARKFSKAYNPPNRKLISKYVLDIIHGKNIQSNLTII